MGVAERYNARRKKREEENNSYVGGVAERYAMRNNANTSRKEEDDGLLDFFQKGAFDDGIDWHDFITAPLASSADLTMNVVKGAAGLVEGLTDLVGYGAAGVADWVGADDWADRTKDKLSESWVDNLLKPAEDFLDDYSVWGRTTDSVAQGLGQVGTILATGGIAAGAGLGTAATTALTTGTMGLSGVGSGMGEAYQSGATDGEALTYGLISGAADAATELLFGGLGKGVKAVGISSGLGGVDDMVIKGLTSKINNTLTKNIAQAGLKAGGEGLEEVLAGFAQAWGKSITYKSEEDLMDIIQDENLLEQFVVGALTSGISQVGDVSRAAKSGQDFITGYTDNEQKVYDKLYETAVEKAEEKSGKKLTAKEKNAIHDRVQKMMDEGDISTDLIEEVLGGDEFTAFNTAREAFNKSGKAYQDTVAEEKAVFDEYDVLKEKIEDGSFSYDDLNRFNELLNKKKEIAKSTKRSDMKAQLDAEATRIAAMKQDLSKNVSGMVGGTRLAESYNERARRGQAFEADLSKYDEKQKATIQKAIDSGILNNAKKTHRFVDWVARISADQGINIDFANNEKIKESGFGIKDKVVNGYVTKDGITINIQAANALNSVVGHEVTHVFEGTDFYDPLQKAVFNLAKTKGEYDSRLAELKERYKNVKDADVQKELTADLVGDYLFTDPDFINNLAKTDRNLFQKIFDEIKYMLKVATAGSKEARQLEKVKRAFEKAYNENIKGKKTETEQKNTAEGTKYALENGNKRKYNKRSKSWYSQSETEYMRWEKGSAKPGDVRSFNRFGKTRYYEKTENGCVELSRAQYNERVGIDVRKDYKRAKSEISETANYDESTGRVLPGYHDSDRNTGANEVVFGQALREEFSDVSGGSVPSADGYNRRTDVTEYDEEASGYPGASITFSNDYATIRNFMKDGDTAEVDVKYSLVDDPGTIDFLENQDHLTVYKAMVQIDGKLYPPMASQNYVEEEYTTKKGEKKTRRVRKLKNPSVLGQWQQAEERPDLINSFVNPSSKYPDGYGQFDLLKSNGKTTGGVAYNPYEHTSNIVLNDQFAEAYQRPELVTVEYHIPVSELTSGYKAKYAKDPVGLTDWKAGGVAQKLKNSHRDVYLTRWSKPVRVLSDAEVAQKYKEILDKEEGISVPWNVVTPSLRAELEKIGVPIDYSDIKAGSTIRSFEAAMRGDYDKSKKPQKVKYSVSDSEGNQLSQEQAEYFKDSKMRDDSGNLKVMYHGSQNGGFTVFDPNYSDDDISLFFVDRNDVAMSYSGTSETYAPMTFKTADDLNNFFAEIGQTDYEVVEKDGSYTLYDDGDEIAASESLDEIFEEFKDWAGVGYGDVNYKVYLNLKNPLVVDADDRNWNALNFKTPDETIRFEVQNVKGRWRIKDNLNGDYLEIDRAVAWHKEEYAQEALDDYLKSHPKEQTIVKTVLNKTRDVAKYAKANGYDGVIFNNIRDNGGFSNGSEGASTVAIAFDSNQVKSVANDKPTADPDIRYSLSEDSKGRELPQAVKNRFANSKVVDENGYLKVVYHGTAAGEFSIFDKSKGSVEGDFGSGFYFSDNEYDVSNNYEDGGPDFDNKVARLAEQIEAEEDIDYDEAEERARAELYKGGHRFEVYLNIENPAIVGKTVLFDNESYMAEYNEEDYDDYDDYIADVEQHLTDDIENIVWEVENNVDVYNIDGLANVLYEAYYDGGIGIEELKARINELYLEDSNGNLVGNEVTRQIIESLGYDGIIDPTVSTKWNMDMEDGTTHYIVFKPNQIKDVTNQNPTDNPDIHRSLSEAGTDRKQYGSYNVYGDDIALESEDVAPVQEDVAPAPEVETAAPVDVPEEELAEMFPDDLAPMQSELSRLLEEKDVLENRLREVTQRLSSHDATEQDMADFQQVSGEYDALMKRIAELEQKTDINDTDRFDGLMDEDAPLEIERVDNTPADTVSLSKKNITDIAREVKAALGLNNKQMYDVHKLIEDYSKNEFPSREKLFQDIKEKLGTYTEKYKDQGTADAKKELRTSPLLVDDIIRGEIADFNDLRKRNRGKIRFSRSGIPVDVKYIELSNAWPYLFPESIINPTDQFLRIVEVANMDSTATNEQPIDDATLWGVTDDIIEYVNDIKQLQKEMDANKHSRESFDSLMMDADMYAPLADDDIAPVVAPTDTTEAMEESVAPTVEKPATEAPAVDKPIKTVKERLSAKLENFQKELAENQRLRKASWGEYDREIARLQAAYNARKNKATIGANDILRRIERLQRMKRNNDADFAKRISDLEKRLEKLHTKEAKTAAHRQEKMEQHTAFWENLIGDTSTWKDLPFGLAYKTKTLRRILRKVVRDGNGNPDIAKADAIYDALETKYDHNEAQLKQESKRLKAVFQDLKLNHKEDTYAHMLGELRHNPETTLTEDVVKEYYEKHKGSIDTVKVDKAIEEARKTFDELIKRVNERLREQGMKEIPYRKGYFPHFTNPKQGRLAKLFNWKTVDDEIPTSIAGLTEMFEPQRSWQSFNKERKGDTTDYSLYQGLDTYIHGALDWIYHIDDLQSRRALENLIRYNHSEEGVKEKIKEIKANEEYDADEAQQMIDAVLAEAANPLNNLVTELRARTNNLANKKASMDRGMEEATNRKIYSVMTNLNNRVTANMVVGSFSAALTNFIPIVQSWHQVSPVYSVRGIKDFISSTIRDDGMVAKSDFLTNRLMEEENLYQTGWDKTIDKVAVMMNVIDNITAQTVWRSKYLQNLNEGMSENQAIKDADQFAKNVIAGRSRGNAPSIFDAKNPLVKAFTAFQLEVANQYGYMFEDVPQDSKNKARLVKGFATAFMGAYVYNALYSSLVGRNVAFDPISIVEELLRDMGLFGDDEEEEEPEDVIFDLTDNILEQVPFVGGLFGGGRVPISSAIPYASDSTPLQSFVGDAEKFFDGDWEPMVKEMLKPLYYLALPVGGGQIKKTVEGLSMFSDEHPIAGSYTDSGNLRFPVEDTFGNRLQAAMFGQWASQNARDYFDNDWAPLSEKQTQEFIDVDIPIQDYRAYREGLKGKDTAGEKVAYIAGLDLPIDKQNLLANNLLDRKEPIDLTDWYAYDGLEEFDYAKKYPEKYMFLEANGISVEEYNDFDEDTKRAYTWAYQNPGKFTMSKVVANDLMEYRLYTSDLNDIEADKDEHGDSISGSAKEKRIAYINGLDLDYGQKIILYRSMYNSADDRRLYNAAIVEYLNSRTDLSYEDIVTILEELDFTVYEDGTVRWD